MGIRVDGHSYLERDEDTTAIVSTDKEAWKLQKMRRQRFKMQTEEINTLKEDMSEMKEMLKQLMEKVSG